MEDTHHVPFRFARLIILFTSNMLSPEEHDELDKWVEASDENLEVFEALTSGLEDKIFSANDLIIETEDLLDVWMIAGLLARKIEGIISEEEQRSLDVWVEASEKNKALYELLQDKTNLQKLLSWVRNQRSTNTSRLN